MAKFWAQPFGTSALKINDTSAIQRSSTLAQNDTLSVLRLVLPPIVDFMERLARTRTKRQQPLSRNGVKAAR